MVIWTLARKDLRLLVRDARALVILLVMPLIFVLVLGVSLGEGFGQKPADRLRVTVLNLDEGLPRYFDRPAMVREAAGWWAVGTPTGTGLGQVLPGTGLAMANAAQWFPRVSWSDE